MELKPLLPAVTLWPQLQVPPSNCLFTQKIKQFISINESNDYLRDMQGG